MNTVDDKLFDHLRTLDENFQPFDQNVEDFYSFLAENSVAIGNGTREKALRFFKDTVESANNLIAIHSHRTPVSLRLTVLFLFIFFRLFIHQPSLIKLV